MADLVGGGLHGGATSATLPVNSSRPLPPRAMATWMRKSVTRAALAATSAAASTLAPLKVSITPRAPASSAFSTTDCPRAGKTDSWHVGHRQLVDHRPAADPHPGLHGRLDVADRSAQHDQVLARADRAGDEQLDGGRLEHLVFGQVAQADAGEFHGAD